MSGGGAQAALARVGRGPPTPEPAGGGPRPGRGGGPVHLDGRDFRPEDGGRPTTPVRFGTGEEATQRGDASVGAKWRRARQLAESIEGAAAGFSGLIGAIVATDDRKPTREPDGVRRDSGNAQGGRVGEPLASGPGIRFPGARGLGLRERLKELGGEAGLGQVIRGERLRLSLGGQEDTGGFFNHFVGPGLGSPLGEERGAMIDAARTGGSEEVFAVG